jgi:hypothetical protein
MDLKPSRNAWRLSVPTVARRGIFKLPFLLRFEKRFQMVHKTVSIEKPERIFKQTQSNL